MKFLCIALIALITLSGNAGQLSFINQAMAGGKAEAAPHGNEAGKGKKGEAGKEDHGSSSAINFVRLDPLVLPIIDGSGVNQVVSLVIVLEAKNQFAATEVRRLSPRLKDAYIQNMYGMLNHKASLEGGVLKVVEIKKMLNKITKKVMGEDAVNDVLLEVVQQRPI